MSGIDIMPAPALLFDIEAFENPRPFPERFDGEDLDPETLSAFHAHLGAGLDAMGLGQAPRITIGDAVAAFQDLDARLCWDFDRFVWFFLDLCPDETIRVAAVLPALDRLRARFGALFEYRKDASGGGVASPERLDAAFEHLSAWTRSGDTDERRAVQKITAAAIDGISSGESSLADATWLRDAFFIMDAAASGGAAYALWLIPHSIQMAREGVRERRRIKQDLVAFFGTMGKGVGSVLAFKPQELPKPALRLVEDRRNIGENLAQL